MNFLRLSSYFLIWMTYISFISIYAPLGADWQDWHAQRIINAVQYLEFNGYLSSYGYTIWSDCTDCNLDASFWKDKIYLSTHGFSFLPYIFINHFFGLEALINHAHLADKVSIFFTALILSEIMIIYLNRISLPNFFIGILVFSLFIISPWTYKMIIAGWTEIYFVLFFMLSILAGIHDFKKLSVFFIFIAGLFNAVWSFALCLFYLLIYAIPKVIKEPIDDKNYFPSLLTYTKGLEYFISLCISLTIFFILRILAQSNLDNASGSSILERIGISGLDIHNGGILGAMQFLGGNRVTKCVYSYENSILTSDLNIGIQAYNCILSISSLILLSIVAIIGLLCTALKYEQIKKIVLPLSFSFIFLMFLFQQSFSVHLQGYSYIFSVLFSIGISFYFFNFLTKSSNISLAYILAGPLYMGILILCVRVSMLS